QAAPDEERQVVHEEAGQLECAHFKPHRLRRKLKRLGGENENNGDHAKLRGNIREPHEKTIACRLAEQIDGNMRPRPVNPSGANECQPAHRDETDFVRVRQRIIQHITEQDLGGHRNDDDEYQGNAKNLGGFFEPEAENIKEVAHCEYPELKGDAAAPAYSNKGQGTAGYPARWIS